MATPDNIQNPVHSKHVDPASNPDPIGDPEQRVKESPSLNVQDA